MKLISRESKDGMDFGLFIRPEVTYEKMLASARKAETCGFSSVFLNDHVHGFADEGKEPYLEAWTAMTGLGVQTNLRVGHIVLFNSLRNPALLAKMISTLDVMTDGRYELLIGAGWNEPEYLGYDLMEKGRGMPSPKERVDRLIEAVEILRLMLNNEVSSYHGEYYTLQNAINIPQPAQKNMRLSIGANKPRLSKFAAEKCDGLNITGKLSDIVERHKFACEVLDTAGKSVSEYFFSGFSGINIGSNDEEVKELAKTSAKRYSISVEEAIKETLVGTTHEIVEKLAFLRDEVNFKLLVTSINLSPLYGNENPFEFFKDNVLQELS